MTNLVQPFLWFKSLGFPFPLVLCHSLRIFLAHLEIIDLISMVFRQEQVFRI